jgi:hypothetical protein
LGKQQIWHIGKKGENRCGQEEEPRDKWRGRQEKLSLLQRACGRAGLPAGISSGEPGSAQIKPRCRNARPPTPRDNQKMHFPAQERL